MSFDVLDFRGSAFLFEIRDFLANLPGRFVSEGCRRLVFGQKVGEMLKREGVAAYQL
jgi:hypothetical protein